MAQQNIHRNLESGQIYIPSFHSGLYTQRNPIFTPLSAMGLQMISRYDTLWDGLNMELSNASTLQRRPGFPVFCSTPIVSLYGSGGALNDSSVDVFPLTFFSFKNNKGVIRLMMDTNDAVYTFDQNINTPLFQKQTAQQTSFAKVGDWVYMVDGMESKKWDGSIVPTTIISEPLNAPTFSISSGPLLPVVGYEYAYAYQNTTGAVGVASPASTLTGPSGVTQSTITSKSVVTYLPVSPNEEIEVQAGTNTLENILTYGLLGIFDGGGGAVGLWYLQGDKGAHPRPYDGSAVSLHPGNIVTVYYNDIHERPGPDQVLIDAFNSPVGAFVWITDTFLPASLQGLHQVTAYGADKPYHDSQDTHNWFQFICSGNPASLWQVSFQYYRQVTITTTTNSSGPAGIGQAINVTGASSPDPTVNIIQVYRTKDQSSGNKTLYFLANIPNPYPAAWTYRDVMPDVGLNLNLIASNPTGGEGLSIMGIGTPTTAPTFYFSVGPLLPIVGYSYLYSGKNSYTDHVGTASPVSLPIGSVENQTISEGTFNTQVTNMSWAPTSFTVFLPNIFLSGQKVTMSGWTGVASRLNGVVFTIATATASYFTVLSSLFSTQGTGNYVASIGVLLSLLVVVPPSPYTYTVQHASSFVSDGGVKWTTGVAATLDTNPPAAGKYYSDGAGHYIFNVADAGKGFIPTYTYALAAGAAGVAINLSGETFADPQVDMIEIYRNNDGGSLYYFLADIPNTYPSSTWQYTDTTLDIGLDTDIVAPINHSNDLPPVGANLLSYWMGRLWCAYDNFVAFAAGPDCTVGVGEEAWPPANVFAFPGKVTGLAPTTSALVVFTSDDMFLIQGTSLVSFYPSVYQKNFGVLSQNCIAQDGDLLFMYTSARQLYMFSGGMSEVGFAIGNKFSVGFNPSSTILALHRAGPDSGLFISDGTSSMYKYRIDQQAWSPLAQVVGGSGALASIETSVGEYTLLTGQSISGGFSANYILGRNTLVFQDCGVSYPAFAVVGTLVLAPPGTTSILDSVMIERMPVGSDATVSILCNEIAGGYIVLPNPVNDPPLLAPQTSIIAKRHYVRAAQTPVSQQVRHLLVQIAFPAEAAKNELLSLALN